MWSSVACPLLSSKPRAGHSVIALGCTATSPQDQDEGREGPITTHCKLLVFGGSDCAGNFYSDTVKCTVEVKLAPERSLVKNV